MHNTITPVKLIGLTLLLLSVDLGSRVQLGETKFGKYPENLLHSRVRYSKAFQVMPMPMHHLLYAEAICQLSDPGCESASFVAIIEDKPRSRGPFHVFVSLHVWFVDLVWFMCNINVSNFFACSRQDLLMFHFLVWCAAIRRRCKWGEHPGREPLGCGQRLGRAAAALDHLGPRRAHRVHRRVPGEEARCAHAAVYLGGPHQCSCCSAFYTLAMCLAAQHSSSSSGMLWAESSL